VTSRPEPTATAPPGGSPLSPAARSLLRWLPTAEPAGAFAGQHDQVHCPSRGLHARVNLWWSDEVVHPGTHVGPPRGGMAPGTAADYSVALPHGGYLWVEAGVLSGWQARTMPDAPLIRADGQIFDPGRYSAMHPYFRRHYDRVTASVLRSSLGVREDKQGEAAQVLRAITESRDPVLCGCEGAAPTSPPGSFGLVMPEALLVDSGTLRVLLGEADSAEASATLWRLNSRIWDPARAGRALAAEAVARSSGESARGWPEAPTTEQAVAHVAAQAIRFHGAALVAAMPAWLLGWVMVAGPVLATVGGRDGDVAQALDASDRVRIARVETQLHAMAAARLMLSRSSTQLEHLADPTDLAQRGPTAAAPVDVTEAAMTRRPDQASEQVGGLALRDAVRLAYQHDARSWFALLGQ